MFLKKMCRVYSRLPCVAPGGSGKYPHTFFCSSWSTLEFCFWRRVDNSVQCGSGSTFCPRLLCHAEQFRSTFGFSNYNGWNRHSKTNLLMHFQTLPMVIRLYNSQSSQKMPKKSQNGYFYIFDLFFGNYWSQNCYKHIKNIFWWFWFP